QRGPFGEELSLSLPLKRALSPERAVLAEEQSLTQEASSTQLQLHGPGFEAGIN
ncbi:hypothetical protein P7K49_016916, partial [Saguinus oedipus]